MENTFRGQELAGWWRRVAAYAVDGMLLFFAWNVLVFFAATMLSGRGSSATILFLLLVTLGFLMLSALYWGFSMSREEANGQSPGKQLLGIRVMREDGLPVDFRLAVQRQVLLLQLLFGLVALLLTGGILWLLDGLWPLRDERRQALHDKIVRTRVTKI